MSPREYKCSICKKIEKSIDCVMTDFTGTPGYGSVHDFCCGGFLRIWICDSCLESMADGVEFVSHVRRTSVEEKVMPWHANECPEWHHAKLRGLNPDGDDEENKSEPPE